MKVGIVANPQLKGLNEFLRRALAVLEGHDVLLETSISAKYPKLAAPLSGFDVDAIITIGGDGTVLYTIQNIPKQVPILSVRAGLLGFLTEIDKRDLEDGIERLLAGKYQVEEKMRISSKVDGKHLPDALNEVVIHTSQIAKLRQFNVKVDGQLAARIRADGLIFATPTGSTSYALSVGAPIIDPRLEAIVIAPIAPLWLAAKTTVVPATSKIIVTLEVPRQCTIVADGRDEVIIEGGERLEVMKSKNPAKLVRFDPNFYRRMNEKLLEALTITAESYSQ
ncbi:MAG: NAD(+)/NADH kinase [Thermoplasmata archaeon]